MRNSTRGAGLLGIAALVLAVGTAPLTVSGADHLDAPLLGGISDGLGNFSPHSERGAFDINDVYVFQGADPSRTVLVMTTNPAINLFGGAFSPTARYVFNVDRDGDAIQDLAYVIEFGSPSTSAGQAYTVSRYTGRNAQTLETGNARGSGSTAGTGRTSLKGNGIAFAGVRSDPFFFDLVGFAGSIAGVGTGVLGQEGDFFVNLNTNAIVLEVPDDQLGGQIGVWAATLERSGSTWLQVDQMGRPAINTVFNPTADKNAFNVTPPSAQRTAMGGKFRNNVIGVLGAFSALDSEGPYTSAQAAALADILLPDLLTYDTSTSAAGPLNGRALADDVIDVELNIVTGGFPFSGRDAIGGVPGDNVGPHSDYLSSFPYLGVAP
jgi:hypothetical protein